MSEVFKLCVAAPIGVSGVDEGSRVKGPETKINKICVRININIKYYYYHL